MKWLLILLLSQSVFADEFNIKDSDKQLHLAVSYAATLSGTALYEKMELPVPTLLAGATTMLAGYLKERTDKVYSKADMQANGYGTLAGMVFCWTFKF